MFLFDFYFYVSDNHVDAANVFSYEDKKTVDTLAALLHNTVCSEVNVNVPAFSIARFLMIHRFHFAFLILCYCFVIFPACVCCSACEKV